MCQQNIDMLSGNTLILIVENEEAHAELIRRAFEYANQRMRLHIVHTLAAAQAYVQTNQPNLAIIDLLLPDGQGTTLLTNDTNFSTFPTIIMTSYGNERIAVEAVKAGALDYVVKSPEAMRDLPRVAERALREWNHLIEQRRAEDALLQSERRFRALTEHSSDVICVLNATGMIKYISPSVQRILGYPTDERLGQNGFELVHPDDQDYVLELFSYLHANPHELISAEFRLLHANNSWCWVEATGTNLLSDPAIQGTVINYRDVTERKEAELRLQHDALHDYLTGLPNRLLCVDHIAQSIARTYQQPESQFAVLFLDLDRFKVVNDSLGHRLGDQLLKAVAARLSTYLDSDTICARLGGDEFVIVVNDIDNDYDAIALAETILYQLTQPFDINGLRLVTSASIGVVLSRGGYTQSEDVLRDADLAMYHAKSQGKSRYAIFDVEMHQQVLERLALEAQMRSAIEHQEFEVYYQPIVELQSGTIEGFEALVRWNHPEHGIISPAEFVPIAEETGLIVEIDWLVLKTASQQMRIWQDTLCKDTPIVMSVNFSSQQFSQCDLVERINAVLEETCLDPTWLRLEITESTLMENINNAAAVLNELHTLGIQVAIDDFGTGYSSLSYLVSLPLNVLKIDRHFIHQMEQQSTQRELVKTIVTMAHNLGLHVVAEGVETPSQHTRLGELGCKWIQGYLISHPLCGTEITDWYLSWNLSKCVYQV